VVQVRFIGVAGKRALERHTGTDTGLQAGTAAEWDVGAEVGVEADFVADGHVDAEARFDKDICKRARWM